MRKLTVSEKVNYPLVWLSANYYDYALQTIEQYWLDDKISTARADWLKAIVFKNFFQYYLLFFPIYTLWVIIVVMAGVIFGILHTITFKKIPIFISIYSKLNILSLKFHIYVLNKEYKAQFISYKQYLATKQSLEKDTYSHLEDIKKR